MLEVNNTAREVYHGHKAAGLTRAQLTPTSRVLIRGIYLYCPGGDDPTPNTATVWVGGATVTADSDANSGGIPLVPGNSIFLQISDPSLLYVISTSASQDVAWIGQ